MKNATALLLIDIQNDYFPGGKMELNGAREAALQAAAVLQGFRACRLPVIHVAHESAREGATFFLPGTKGQRIHDLVLPGDGEQVVTKHFPNSFHRTSLADLLGRLGVGELLIAGMMTHMCVDATLRAAKDLGFVCRLVHDATATRALSFGGVQVAAAQVQAAFIAALASICDGVVEAEETVRSLRHPSL